MPETPAARATRRVRALDPRPRLRSARDRGWTLLLSESWRSALAFGLGALLVLVAQVVPRLVGEGEPEVTTNLLVALAGYLVGYVVLSVLAFTWCSWAQVMSWCRAPDRIHLLAQLVGASRPGPGVASGVSLAALAIGVVWLPLQTRDGSLALGSGLIVLAVIIVVFAWLTVAVTYAVAYLQRDVRSGHRALSFPGEDVRSVEDYAYLALAISTTFGTTDVEVRQTPVRRLAAGHSVLAFILNTVVLAGVVSMLVASQR